MTGWGLVGLGRGAAAGLEASGALPSPGQPGRLAGASDAEQPLARDGRRLRPSVPRRGFLAVQQAPGTGRAAGQPRAGCCAALGPLLAPRSAWGVGTN